MWLSLPRLRSSIRGVAFAEKLAQGKPNFHRIRSGTFWNFGTDFHPFPAKTYHYHRILDSLFHYGYIQHVFFIRKLVFLTILGDFEGKSSARADEDVAIAGGNSENQHFESFTGNT
jgi:hypothetical protein